MLLTNPLTKALAYAQKRKAALEVFLTDPDVPLDTNPLERALRPISMGRKNWLFSWTELGAQHVGVIQSLIATCRLHEIDPYEYLVDVLQRVGQHPTAKVDQLTPRLWKQHFGKTPLISDYQKHIGAIMSRAECLRNGGGHQGGGRGGLQTAPAFKAQRPWVCPRQ